MTLKLRIQHFILKYYQIASNDDPRLTIDLFPETFRSDLLPDAFIWEKAQAAEFSEPIKQLHEDL